MNTFHNQRVFYREGLLQFYCIASLNISGWGLHVQIEPEIDREPFTVAGAWEILSIPQIGLLHYTWIGALPFLKEKNEIILSCTLKLPIPSDTNIFDPNR